MRGTGVDQRPFVSAHLGWLFGKDTTSATRFAPDLPADRDVVVVSRLFPLWAVASLAVPSMGESLHNFHHASPSSARHGVLAHQLDSSARLIRMFEGAGWATKVRWPTPSRLGALSS